MQPATQPAITGWDNRTVSDFSKGDLDILILERPLLDDLSAAVEAGRVHEFLAPVCRDKVGFEVKVNVVQQGI